MENQYDKMTKKDVLNELERYLKVQEDLYEHIKSFKEGNRSDREIAQIILKEIYGAFKDEMNKHYKSLSSSRVSRNSITDSYFWPVIQDIHVHISGVGINSITINGMSDFYSAVYDIGSYAGYWKSHMN